MHVENGGKWVVSFKDAEIMQLQDFATQLQCDYFGVCSDLEQIRSISFWKKMSPRISFIKVELEASRYHMQTHLSIGAT